jgi:hypothetical protein
MIFYYKNVEKEIDYDDIPENIKHIAIPSGYSFGLLNIPEYVNELTLQSKSIIPYNSIVPTIEILNICLLTIGYSGIKIDNLPPTLKKLRLLDYSKHTEFEFLTNNLYNSVYSIEERRRNNMKKIINGNIIKIPFDCMITNKFDEELLDIIINKEDYKFVI